MHMTQCNDTKDKSAEMEKIFVMLSDENQENALNILQSLQQMQSQIQIENKCGVSNS